MVYDGVWCSYGCTASSRETVSKQGRKCEVMGGALERISRDGDGRVVKSLGGQSSRSRLSCRDTVGRNWPV